jgi:hypothetical protein
MCGEPERYVAVHGRKHPCSSGRLMDRFLQNNLVKIHKRLHRNYLLRPILIACLIGILSTTLGAQQDHLLPSGLGSDLQNTDELEVSTRLTSVVDATWVAQTRFSSQLPNPATYILGAEFNINVSKWLIITPSYYYFAFRTLSNGSVHGHDPMVAATLISNWRSFTASDRNRFVGALDITGAANVWVYGNRPKIEYKLRPSRCKCSVFVWDEIFYFANRAGWTRNRFAIGGRKSLSDRIGINLFFQRQTDAYSIPSHINTIEVLFEVRLR